eukprot:Selendium_serpulae@DN6501_c1_g3_i1.p1
MFARKFSVLLSLVFATFRLHQTLDLEAVCVAGGVWLGGVQPCLLTVRPSLRDRGFVCTLSFTCREEIVTTRHTSWTDRSDIQTQRSAREYEVCVPLCLSCQTCPSRGWEMDDPQRRASVV